MGKEHDLWLEGIGVRLDRVIKSGKNDNPSPPSTLGADEEASRAVLETLDEQNELTRGRAENLEKGKEGLEKVTSVLSGIDLIKDVVKDQWPAVKEFIEHAGLIEDLEVLEKSAKVTEFIAEFGEFVITIKQGGSAGDVFAATMEMALASAKALPKDVQAKFFQAIGEPFGKFLGSYGDRAVKILGQAGRVLEVQKAMLDYMRNDGGVSTLLNQLPKLGTDLGPPVVGLLVQIATSELGPEQSKLAGDIAQRVIEFGAKALDKLGKDLIKAEDDLGDAYAHESRVAAKTDREFEKRGRELGLDAWEAAQFAQACQLGGKDRMLDLVSSLKQNRDTNGLHTALNAFAQANRLGIIEGRAVDGLDEQSDKQQYVEIAGRGIETATKLAMSARKGSIERRVYEALLVDQQAIQKRLYDMMKQ